MGLKFYPSACADTKFEFTHFAAEKLHRTSEEFLYYLDNHYTYALQHTQSKFMDFIVYITRKLPINISTQILNHIECFSGNLYNKLYKRRKSKISELVYNTYGTRDCFHETHEGIYKRPLDTNINHMHGRKNFTSFYSDNNVSFNNSSPSGFITDLQSNFHEIRSGASSSTIEGVCAFSESRQMNHDNSATSIRSDSDRAESKLSKKPRRFDRKCRKRKHRTHGLNISAAHHSPINFTYTTVSQSAISLLKKGPSFVPTPKAVDWGKLGQDFIKFKNKLRWRAHFFLMGKTDAPSDTELVDVNSSDENLYRCFKSPSDRKAPVCKDNALELFLELVERDIFHPDNAKVKFKCNLTTDERDDIRDLVNNEDIVIRIQDKGSRFVLLNSTDYVDKMEDYLNDNPSFCTLYEDPTDTFLQRVSAWSQKWLSKGEINDTVIDFVTNHSAQPAKNYGLVKTHKPGCKLRVITAGSNSATIQYAMLF